VLKLANGNSSLGLSSSHRQCSNHWFMKTMLEVTSRSGARQHPPFSPPMETAQLISSGEPSSTVTGGLSEPEGTVPSSPPIVDDIHVGFVKGSAVAEDDDEWETDSSPSTADTPTAGDCPQDSVTRRDLKGKGTCVEPVQGVPTTSKRMVWKVVGEGPSAPSAVETQVDLPRTEIQDIESLFQDLCAMMDSDSETTATPETVPLLEVADTVVQAENDSAVRVQLGCDSAVVAPPVAQTEVAATPEEGTGEPQVADDGEELEHGERVEAPTMEDIFTVLVSAKVYDAFFARNRELLHVRRIDASDVVAGTGVTRSLKGGLTRFFPRYPFVFSDKRGLFVATPPPNLIATYPPNESAPQAKLFAKQELPEVATPPAPARSAVPLPPAPNQRPVHVELPPPKPKARVSRMSACDRPESDGEGGAPRGEDCHKRSILRRVPYVDPVYDRQQEELERFRAAAEQEAESVAILAHIQIREAHTRIRNQLAKGEESHELMREMTAQKIRFLVAEEALVRETQQQLLYTEFNLGFDTLAGAQRAIDNNHSLFEREQTARVQLMAEMAQESLVAEAMRQVWREVFLTVAFLTERGHCEQLVDTVCTYKFHPMNLCPLIHETRVDPHDDLPHPLWCSSDPASPYHFSPTIPAAMKAPLPQWPGTLEAINYDFGQWLKYSTWRNLRDTEGLEVFATVDHTDWATQVAKIGLAIPDHKSWLLPVYMDMADLYSPHYPEFLHNALPAKFMRMVYRARLNSMHSVWGHSDCDDPECALCQIRPVSEWANWSIGPFVNQNGSFPCPVRPRELVVRVDLSHCFQAQYGIVHALNFDHKSAHFENSRESLVRHLATSILATRRLHRLVTASDTVYLRSLPVLFVLSKPVVDMVPDNRILSVYPEALARVGQSQKIGASGRLCSCIFPAVGLECDDQAIVKRPAVVVIDGRSTVVWDSFLTATGKTDEIVNTGGMFFKRAAEGNLTPLFHTQSVPCGLHHLSMSQFRMPDGEGFTLTTHFMVEAQRKRNHYVVDFNAADDHWKGAIFPARLLFAIAGEILPWKGKNFQYHNISFSTVNRYPDVTSQHASYIDFSAISAGTDLHIPIAVPASLLQGIMPSVLGTLYEIDLTSSVQYHTSMNRLASEYKDLKLPPEHTSSVCNAVYGAAVLEKVNSQGALAEALASKLRLLPSRPHA